MFKRLASVLTNKASTCKVSRGVVFTHIISFQNIILTPQAAKTARKTHSPPEATDKSANVKVVY